MTTGLPAPLDIVQDSELLKCVPVYPSRGCLVKPEFNLSANDLEKFTTMNVYSPITKSESIRLWAAIATYQNEISN